jgi:iron complex transport system ATP-binding protein
MLKASNISFKVGSQYLLGDTSVAFEPGKFHVIMGANGAGKSTLLKILSGNQKPSSGQVLMNGEQLAGIDKKALAQLRAVLSQHYHITFPITVNDVVLMGRYPYYGQNPAAADKAICKEAMQTMQVHTLAERDYNSLSGGEAQKVQMSRVLAQIGNVKAGEQKILFLDEPVSHLDLRYQHQLLEVAKKLTQQSITVIAVLHDINLALSFANRILFMKSGAILHEVTNPYAVTSLIINDVFDIQSQVVLVGEEQKPVIVF